MTEVIIREAKVGDAAGIAKVHVNSWKETYTGIVPDSYLDTHSEEKREQMWKSILGENRDGSFTFVAEKSGSVIGFVNGGEAREKEYGYSGELCAIYLLKREQGTGVGKNLFLKFTKTLFENGFQNMYLWVLRDNPTIEFYKAMGGSRGTEKEDEIGGKKLIEDLYGWNEIS